MPYKDPEKRKAYQKEYGKQHFIANRAAYRAASKRSKENRRPRKQEFVRRHKLLCGCKRCGYRESHYALEYHHIDPSQKDSTVSRLLSGNWSLKTIKKEIKKCVVLCSNCHRLTHDEINQGIVHDWKLPERKTKE